MGFPSLGKDFVKFSKAWKKQWFWFPMFGKVSVEATSGRLIEGGRKPLLRRKI
jgi:hypothetical protein